MKEQLTNELIKLLQTANGAATGASDVIKQKVPELCHQIINWELTFHGIFAALFLIVLSYGIYMMKQRWEIHKDKINYDSADFIWIVGLTTSLMGGFILIVNVVCLLCAIISPDLVVLDYFKYIK